MYAHGFRFYFTPLPGFFSPFPHGTGSLSVDHEYLALEDGPPIFEQDYTCPALLVATPSTITIVSSTGLSPSTVLLPSKFDYYNYYLVAAAPISFATTFRISVDFFSSSYLDVSVHSVRLLTLCIQIRIPPKKRWVSPFGYLRINAHLPTPRSFSQAITSFFACDRQGIHHVHLVT